MCVCSIIYDFVPSDFLKTILPRTGMQGFGYVLTANFDVDGNKYAGKLLDKHWMIIVRCLLFIVMLSSDFAVGGFPGDPASSIEIMR